MADKKIIKFSRKRNKKLAKKIYRIVRIPLAVLAVVFAVFLSARMLGEVAVSNISDAFRQIPYIFSHGSGLPVQRGRCGQYQSGAYRGFPRRARLRLAHRIFFIGKENE